MRRASVTPPRRSPSPGLPVRVAFNDEVRIIPQEKKEEKNESSPSQKSPERSPGRQEGLSKGQKKRERRKFRRSWNRSQEAGHGVKGGAAQGDPRKDEPSRVIRSPTPHPATRRVSVQQ